MLDPLRQVGKLISDISVQIMNIHSATVVSDSVTPSETVIVLDTSPQDRIPARSLAGRLEAGARVVCLAYPPRGLIILGRVDEPAISPVVPVGSLLVYDANSSLTATDLVGVEAVKFRVWGGGGGGGQSLASTAGNSSSGSGGGGGGYAETILPVSSLVLPVAITVGASVVNNTNGNPSSAGAYCAANGGGAGTAGAVGATVGVIAAAGAPGAGTIGDFGLLGGWGGAGYRLVAGFAMPGAGGGPAMGSGADGARGATSATGPGTSGSFGQGGGGGSSAGLAAAQAGGNGGQGRVIVERIYR